jgi:hypothetical protein
VSHSSHTAEATEAARIFHDAAGLNRSDPLRRHNLLEFPPYGQVVMTGDLHGHRKNFDKLVRYAMLDRAAARHVVLHEMIHAESEGGPTDDSHELLLEVAKYKCEFPEQVHFLQSNHELSQWTEHQIFKNGRPVIEDFVRGVLDHYGVEGGRSVYDAILDFLSSFPIAARTPNRLWLSHSLPAVADMQTFDPAVFSRPLAPYDLEYGGSVYQLVWGRRFSPEQLEQLARMFDVDFFIIGHTPQETGFDVVLDRVIILASDHNHGSFLPIDLARPCTLEHLVTSIRKFVAVA